MRWRRVLSVAVMLGAIGAASAAWVGSASGPARRSPYPARFPAGPGHEIAERACLMCHSAMLVTQQAKDSAGWEKSLATMEKWGAPVAPAERDTLARYLLSNFGARGRK